MKQFKPASGGGKLNITIVLFALSAQLVWLQSASAASGSTFRMLQPAASSSVNSLDQPPPPTTTELPDATTTTTIEPVTSKPGKKKPFEELIDHLQHKIRDTPDAIMVALVQLKENIKLLLDFFQKPYKPKSFESTSFPARESRVDKV